MTLQPQIQLEHWLDEAKAALATGMMTQAAQAAAKALSRSPQNEQARLLAARIELARNEPEAALKTLDAHDLNHPEDRNHPELSLLRAQALGCAGHTQLAQELLFTLTRQFPDDVRAHRLIAGVYLTLEQPAKAQKHLEEVLRLTPSDEVTRRTLAELLSQTSPQDGAALLEKMLQETMAKPGANGDSTGTLSLRMARLYRQVGRERDAEETYRQLLVTEKNDADLWLEAATLADQMGATELAQNRLKQAGQQKNCNAAGVLAAQAMSHMSTGSLAQAGRLWWKLYRQDASHEEAAAGLLVCALALGRSKLVRAAHHELTIHTSRDERRKTIMRLWAQAAGGMVIAKTLRKPSRVAHEDQGSLLLPLLKRSRVKLAAHAASHERRADAQYHLAVCEMATGDAAAADVSVSKAMEINPRYIAAAQLYARLQAGKRAAA